MGHRGPDGDGVWAETVGRWQVELGHTRLAILDLSDAARQPMIDEETGCVLVFNGEIYNFGKRPTNPSSQKVRQGCIVVPWPNLLPMRR